MLCVRGLAYGSFMTFSHAGHLVSSLFFSGASWAALLHLNERVYK